MPSLPDGLAEVKISAWNGHTPSKYNFDYNMQSERKNRASNQFISMSGRALFPGQCYVQGLFTSLEDPMSVGNPISLLWRGGSLAVYKRTSS